MITIHEKTAKTFDTFGLGTLVPGSCVVMEELNGAYELELKHPYDDGGKWKRIERGRILYASTLRLNNYRPYLIGGIYGSVDIGRKKGNPILLKSTDFGFEFGLGCDIYLPYFKLCPELKFCFGLVNLLEKDRPDLVDQANIKYTDALSKATSRMVILTFNFE